MADITMCDGGSCEAKEECYRYRAIPNPDWQSFFQGVPINSNGCQYYCPVASGDHLQSNDALEKVE